MVENPKFHEKARNTFNWPLTTRWPRGVDNGFGMRYTWLKQLVLVQNPTLIQRELTISMKAIVSIYDMLPSAPRDVDVSYRFL